MKYSQFNAIIPYGEKHALYNAFNGKVIFLEEMLKDLLIAARHEGIDELQKVHPSFYSYLAKQSFIVENTVDEIDKVKQLSKTIDENPSIFALTINPSMNCNFKCWYCYETFIKKSRLDEEMIDRINIFVGKKMQKVEFLTLAFFGGEPLLYFEKDVTPIIDNYAMICSAKGVEPSVSFTTNGYLINQAFVDYFKYKNISPSLQITLDGYKEKHDLVRFVSANKGSYDRIIKNIKLLLLNKFPIRLRINYTNDNLEDTHKIGEEFKDIPQEILDNYLLFDYHRVWQNDQLDDLNIVLQKNTAILTEKGIKTSTNYSPNNVKESCYADKRNSAVINFNGDLYKCTARDFTTVKREGYLDEQGDLVWENDNLEKRMNAKFNNKPCLSCPIMPLCNGGCSQHALEHIASGEEYCVYKGDEKEKMLVVKTKIDEIIYKTA
jgi:uncharacterized protein